MTQITIRTIQQDDNQAIAFIIRSCLEEVGLDIPGTAYFDESLNTLYESFQHPLSQYFVALDGEKIIGGVGVFPSEGLPDDTVELVKMYLLPEYRGQGLGKLLIRKCIGQAKHLGYRFIYLESMPELKTAVGVYQKLGFQLLDKPIGETGHYSCSIWMRYEIENYS